ncbi:MAG: type II toxin-antitoxin system RelB/DinJ family antitoxin [Oscillospiraceae bacterium]|nr:type II toxin-antitoxin system RelB/DinJ family antitoxin [Oscillospiraceae bacterium]
MAQTTFTVRMDADTKTAFSELCSNIGMTMSTAFSIFAKKAVSEQRIPFELTANADPFYSESNMKHLDTVIEGIENGTRELTEHDLIEVDE